MAEVKRYIIGYRRGPQFDAKTVQALQDFLDKAGAKVVRKTPVGRWIVEMTYEQMRDLANKMPDLVIEEDQILRLTAMPGLPPRVVHGGEFKVPLAVRDESTGTPIANATAYVLGRSGLAYKALSGDDGLVTVMAGEDQFTDLIVAPRQGYWSRVVAAANLPTDGSLEVRLKPLVATGAYDWGHRMMGFRRVNGMWTGKDVKVALIDSGCSTEVAGLNVAGGYNVMDPAKPDDWKLDEKGHGTHCAGIVAGSDSQRNVLGGAPGVSLYAVKAMPDGTLSDLVEAIEWCIRQRMDVINMSLGMEQPSQVLAQVLRDAYDRGITCVAAAGNQASHVDYPAAYPTVIAVGALGRFGAFPEDSAHTRTISNVTDYRGGMFAAKFSNYGPEVTVSAPGVAILSTVPTGFAAWDGTSAACPMVVALVALILEAHPALRTGDGQQVELVRAVLVGSSYQLGMPAELQGAGMPLTPWALAGGVPARAGRGYSYPGV